MATVQLLFFFSLLQYLKNKLESFNLVGSHSVHVWGECMYPFTDEFTGISIIIKKKKLIFIQEKFVATLLQACDILKKKSINQKYTCHKIKWFHSNRY